MPTLFEIWSRGWQRQRAQVRLNRIVRASVKGVKVAIAGEMPPILAHYFYGSIGIDPKNLVIWFIFETDAQLEEARASGLADRIFRMARDELKAHGYPKPAEVQIAFTSREDVLRRAGGNYHKYFN